MILSAQCEPMAKRFGLKESIKMLKNAGFDAFDLGQYSGCAACQYFAGDDYVQIAKELKEYMDSIGIICNQSHAPFATSTGDAEKDDQIFKGIIKSMEIASILGAKVIVVHPNQHLPYHENIDELKAMNIKFYKKLIPYCEKFGIKVAIENMWQRMPGSNKIMESTCARCDEFCSYVDEVNSEWIVACLDIGHVPLATESLTNIIHALGHRIKALHVHDNDFFEDNHTLPFTSKIDFDNVCKALAKANYNEDFTYEIAKFFTTMPDPLIPSALKFAHDVGRYLISTIENYK